jgi:hypothetical protein
LNAAELKFWQGHFGAIVTADVAKMREKLVFDLCFVAIAIAQLISCTASEVPWLFV